MLLVGALLLIATGAAALLLLGQNFIKRDATAHAAAPSPLESIAVETRAVLVPVRKIDQGEALSPHMFREESRPRTSIAPDAIGSFSEITGRYAKAMMISGEPFTPLYLTSTKPSGQLALQIPDGYRAVAIAVDETSGVEGWVRPGTQVDVSWIGRVRGMPSITVIIQNARILSAERSTEDPTAQGKGGQPVPTTVTLLVTSDDAKKLSLASRAGKLTLSLRGARDSGKAHIPYSTITVNDLIGQQGGDTKAPRPQIIKVRDPDTGKEEEYRLDERGKLVPLA